MIKVNIEITAPTLPDALEELQSFCRDGQEQAPSGAEAQEESVIPFPAAPRKDNEEGVPDENPSTAAEQDLSNSAAAEPTKNTETTVEPTDAEPAPETAAAPATSEPEPPKLKKEDVRAVLMDARAKGIDLTEILKPYGGKLSSVEASDYAAVVAAAKKAMGAKK
jgi:hypothetical protein